MKSEAKQFKNLVLFVSVTLLTAYFLMYQYLLLPNDETGHALGMLMTSLLWALINFINLLRLFITNRMDRLALSALILMLPAAWLTMLFSFHAIFYTKIIEIHPIWGDSGRLPDLADDGILMVLLAIVLAIYGGMLFLILRKGK